MVKEISNIDESKENCIDTRNARIWLDNDGIVRFVFTPSSGETLEDAEDNVAAIKAVCAGKKRPIFIIPGPHKSMSRDARVYYMEKTPLIASACGVLVSSPYQRVLSVFMSVLNKAFNKDRFPMRFFNSDEEAITWLKKFQA